LSGGNPGTATLNLRRVTGGWGTAAQTTSQVGAFSFTGRGWFSFGWVRLNTGGGLPVRLSLSGTNTLRAVTAGGVDANFFMLVPEAVPVPLEMRRDNGWLASFTAAPGLLCTLQARAELASGQWSNLSALVANGARQTIVLPPHPGPVFYRLLIQ
jgi:hypothetical protein